MKKRISGFLMQEKQKLSTLSLNGKIGYIFEYYRFWILGIGFLIFLAGYIVYHAAFVPRDYWLYAVFANTMTSEDNLSSLRSDFASYGGYDTKEKRLELNASSYFDPSVSGGTNNTYYQVFVALVESGDLDIVVMGKEALQALGSSGRLLDLQDERCQKILTRYGSRLIYCDPYDETYATGQVPVGIDISDSILVDNYHIYDDNCVLGIGAYTKRMDEIETFLCFLLEEGGG